MVTSKNRSTPVVDKKEDGTCGCGCKDCSCGCGCGCGKAAWLCGTIFVSALVIAGSVLMQPCMCPKKPPMLPIIRQERPEPRPEMRQEAPAVSLDKDMRKFIMNNPKLLIDSVEKYYQKEEGKAAAAAKAAPKEFKLEDLQKADAALVKGILEDKTNYSLGNPKGKFVIIEFFDYQCGWCKKTNKGMEEAIASAEGKNIRWIPIDTPIFGEASELIARYVLAAGEQGKYAEMHKAVGEATAKVDEAALLEMAKKLKLDTKKLTADANGAKIKKKMEANNELRKALNIGGVPMLIVDGRINPGALIDDRLAAVVKLSAAKK